ncbi:glycyl-tRNA synthetase beta chain [Sphingomonas endophytica]|uniref:Glycine--tRNA ligase beta subunit n=1 Tax=Sphingomonas endophytica TaxID=869719 RepID=A0ABR6N315_9SPHN|nr:glycyl-tRNA synthetase beta chain [Sphingomonas endophytica]
MKGPRASAPPQALEGFLRKTGLTREQLTERDGVLYAITEKPGRATADVLAEAIPAVIRAFPWPKSMRWGDASLSTESLRWVRPLQGIIALFGEQVVPVTIAGVESGAATLGHRFHHPGAITIGSAADYVEKLRACHVIVDQDERAALIRDRATALAAEAGLVLVEDEGLVAENAGLTEWPVPLLGRFDADFLSVPPEVIQLTARVNQKYFVCRDGTGKLANAFVCTANIDAHDGGAKIVEGNRKVLAARLSDARFFYDTDLKVPLEEQAKKLDRIVFHEKLGTVADKVERVAKLARWLVEEGVVKPSPLRGEGLGEGQVSHRDRPLCETPTPHPDPLPGGEREQLAAQAERAARLAKADLVTGMVGEFPELQGLMGGYYAAAQGEDEAVTNAIRDHYKPVGQGDEVPTDPVTVAVSLADKLDTLVAFFVIDHAPTGSKDPYALRRAALSVSRLLLANGLRLELASAVVEAWGLVRDTITTRLHEEKFAEFSKASSGLPSEPRGRLMTHIFSSLQHRRSSSSDEEFATFGPRLRALLDFFADRLKVQQREAGVRHDLIDAVFALGGEDDLVRLLARVRALQSFVGTDDGANLLAGYKRAANILKKENFPVAPAQAGAHVSVDQAASPEEADMGSRLRGNDGGLSYTPEKDEAALIAALDAAEPAAAQAIEREDFEGAMAALASLRAPIDAFFDSVTVNDSDPEKRSTRLILLARVRAAVHKVADFSRIEG